MTDNLGWKEIPPHSLEAEMGLLGAVLLDSGLVEILERTKPEDFYAFQHVLIAQTLIELETNGQPCDVLSLAECLRNAGKLNDIGGFSYLRSLTQTVQTQDSARYLAKIIAEKATLRRIMMASLRMYAAAANGEADAEEAVAQCSKAFEGAVERSRVIEGMSALQLTKQIYDQMSAGMMGEGPKPILSPWRSINHHTGGFLPGDVVVWAGSPGVGKSSAVAQLAEHTARTYGPVLFYALEMGELDTVRRMIAAWSGVNVRRLRMGDVFPNHLEHIHEAMTRVSNLDMTFYGCIPRKSLAEIRRECRRKTKHGPLGSIVIDHPGFIAEAMSGARGSTKHERLDAVYQELVFLAKECETVVHIVQHVNRATDAEKPKLTSLRDGGNLEGHAQIVIFPYRPKPDAEDQREFFIIAKNRDGITGEIEMRFDGASFQWAEAGSHLSAVM